MLATGKGGMLPGARLVLFVIFYIKNVQKY